MRSYVDEYLPARWLATIVPLLVLGLVLLLDPASVLVLLFTGPLLLPPSLRMMPPTRISQIRLPLAPAIVPDTW